MAKKDSEKDSLMEAVSKELKSNFEKNWRAILILKSY
jgi:hypothetical protein